MAKSIVRTWVIVQMGDKQTIAFHRLHLDDAGELVGKSESRIKVTPKMRGMINSFMKNYQCDHSGVTISEAGMGVSMRWSDLKHHKGVLMSNHNYLRSLFDVPYMKLFTGE